MSAYEVVRPVGLRSATSADGADRPERRWGPEDVAAYLDVSVRTIYSWRCSGYGPRGRRVGRYVRYDPDEVRAWFAALGDHPEAS